MAAPTGFRIALPKTERYTASPGWGLGGAGVGLWEARTLAGPTGVRVECGAEC